MLLEVELGGYPDLPKLEASAKVLGNVKSTPRYGTVGGAWRKGTWIETANFDTTLPDRFIIEATHEMAVALSREDWVEWTAPAMLGTVYDEKTVQWWEVPEFQTQAIVGVVGSIIGGIVGYTLKPIDPVVSALIGAGLGAGGGYSLAYVATMGVPQIPALGAAPEGPGASMRLGKYQITG